MFEATWDALNDWSRCSTSGFGSEVVLERLPSGSGLGYIGGVGQIRTSWGSGAGYVTATATLPAADVGVGRKARASMAIRFERADFGPSAVTGVYGPMWITGRNDSASSLGPVIALAIYHDGTDWQMVLTNTYTFEISTEAITLRAHLDEWLIYDWHVESTGSSPNTTTVFVDVWAEGRSGGLRFVRRLTIADITGVYDFDTMVIGFDALTRNEDQIAVQFDELRASFAGSGVANVPLPRLASSVDSSYRAQVRIRRWDEANGRWVRVLDVPDHAVTEVTCSFLAHRVEDAASVRLTDFALADGTSARDLLTECQRDLGARYRLDIHAYDEQARDIARPSGWMSPPLFWSGVIEGRAGNLNRGEREVTLTASGFTSLLRQIVVDGKRYWKQTISAIADDVMTLVSAAWPGGISIMRRPNGFDSRLEIREKQYEGATAADVFDDLSKYGAFFYGVSCSGYPGFERSSSDEFRLVFVEPHLLVEGSPTATSLARGVGMFVDAVNDPRVTSFELNQRDDDHANEWTVVGPEVALDVVGVATGADADRMRDSITAFGSDISGLYQRIIDDPVGMAVEFTYQARRTLNYVDPETGESFGPGRLDRLPPAMREPIGSNVFVITSFTEGTNAIDFFFDEWPGPDQDLTLDYDSVALIYRVIGNGRRIVRTVRNSESTAARETIARVISEGEARGWYQAGTLAQVDHWAQIWQRDEVRIEIAGFRRHPIGRQQLDNLVAISTGNERVTRLGTTAAGGDGWAVGDDERPVGTALTMEVRRVDLKLTPSGWRATLALSAAPVNLRRVFESKDTRLLEGRD